MLTRLGSIASCFNSYLHECLNVELAVTYGSLLGFVASRNRQPLQARQSFAKRTTIDTECIDKDRLLLFLPLHVEISA